MKNNLFLLFTITLFFSSCNDPKNSNSPEQIVNAFFATYEKHGIDSAVNNTFINADQDIKDKLPYIKDTLSKIISMVGVKYYGNEIIAKKNITGSLCMCSYLVKYPIYPLRFTFIFYKPQDKWVILKFTFDAYLSSETEELGKLIFLNLK